MPKLNWRSTDIAFLIFKLLLVHHLLHPYLMTLRTPANSLKCHQQAALNTNLSTMWIYQTNRSRKQNMHLGAWAPFGRVFVKKWRGAGCFSIRLPVEALSPDMINEISAGFHLEEKIVQMKFCLGREQSKVRNSQIVLFKKNKKRTRKKKERRILQGKVRGYPE